MLRINNLGIFFEFVIIVDMLHLSNKSNNIPRYMIILPGSRYLEINLEIQYVTS